MKPARTLLSISTLCKAAFTVLLMLVAGPGFTQFNVTEIITDYKGFWQSSATAINSVKPDNSQNLVAFSFMGKRYSTGVNDAMLASKGQTFIAGDYKALPVNSFSTGANASTKIGLGSLYDGVANGPSIPAPSNNISYYLTDGVKGLDLGTCVANLPAGTVLFPVSKILTTAINDNIPDLVVTQVADPSGSLDRYEFTDILGNRVGNYVDIQLDNIASVGNWTADFYDANKNPMTLGGGYTKTDRPIRLWASDLSAFGINASNASQVAYFRIKLNGNSDVAFVAYNNNAINIFNSLLPVKLNEFTGKPVNGQVQLNWQTGTEINSKDFVVEKSVDGISFTTAGTVSAAGNAAIPVNYACTDKNPASGKNYYRLKLIDKDGATDYSNVITVTIASASTTTTISVYPNPAKNYIVINHPFAGNNEQLHLANLNGNIVYTRQIAAGSLQTRIDLPTLAAGTYELVWTNGSTQTVNKLVIL